MVKILVLYPNHAAVRALSKTNVHGAGDISFIHASVHTMEDVYLLAGLQIHVIVGLENAPSEVHDYLKARVRAPVGA